MKQITIIRHGDSSFIKNNGHDWVRPLSQEGKKECIELAEYLSQNKMLPEKIICSDYSQNRDFFDLRKIHRWHRCMVIVRPDQYIANVLPLDATSDISDFFSGFMVPNN